MHVPEEIIHRLDAASLFKMAAVYRELAHWFDLRARTAQAMEDAEHRRQHAAITRRQSLIDRDREICRLFRAGLSDGQISASVGLSARQVRRITAKLRSAARQAQRRRRRSLGQDQHQAGSDQSPEQPVVLAVAEGAEARQRDQAAA